jgi:3-oxoacyl-[acyl-carrier protein] reductase
MAAMAVEQSGRTRTVLVTGAAQGIGRQHVETLSSLGYVVIAADIRADAAAEVEQTCNRRGGGRVWTEQVDVEDESSIVDLARRVARRGLLVDVLINNAGIGQRRDPFLTTDLRHLRKVVDVNLFGAIICARAFIPGMIVRGWGRVINTSSTAAYTGQAFIYSVSKAAIISLTQGLALECGAFGVTVNAIAPGPIKSPWMEDAGILSQLEERQSNGAVPRLGTPLDLMGLVTLLIGDDASWISGQTFVVDGGLIARL